METVTVRGHSMLAWCAGCDREIELVALEGADALADTPTGGHFKATGDRKTWGLLSMVVPSSKRNEKEYQNMIRRWSFTIFALLFAMLMSRAGQEPLQQELAQARAATAMYHNIDHAIADGYVPVGGHVPGEGFHYANRSLIDGVFEVDRPEALLYTVGPNGQLRLAGVEYLVPLTLSENAPEGFTGSEDVWRANSEGGGLWEMNAWLWLHNPDGMFAAHNPRIQ